MTEKREAVPTDLPGQLTLASGHDRVMTQDVDRSELPVPERPRFTLVQAADLTGISHSTIKRRLRAGAFPQATRDPETNAWLVTPEDLLAAGLVLRTPAQGQRQSHQRLTYSQDASMDLAEPAAVNRVSQPHRPMDAHIAQLEHLLTVERMRREAAEQARDAAERLAAEREKRAALAERALLMLEGRRQTTERNDQSESSNDWVNLTPPNHASLSQGQTPSNEPPSSTVPAEPSATANVPVVPRSRFARWLRGI